MVGGWLWFSTKEEDEGEREGEGEDEGAIIVDVEEGVDAIDIDWSKDTERIGGMARDVTSRRDFLGSNEKEEVEEEVK